LYEKVVGLKEQNKDKVMLAFVVVADVVDVDGIYCCAVVYCLSLLIKRKVKHH
jgi:hypothetical protein